MNSSLISHLRQILVSKRWALNALIFILGAFSGLAMPPVDAWWILGASVPLFLALLKNAKRWMLAGWLFGFGYFLVALHWIAFAFLVDAKADLWMMPFAVGGLAAAAALYWGVAAYVTQKFVQRGFSLWLIFPVCLSIAEYLRGILFTGFPWAVPGLAVDGMGSVAQLASIIGMNGLTLLILLWAAMPLAYVHGYKKQSLLVVSLLPLAWVWGQWRLSENPTRFVDGVGVRLVQPNISASDKWRGDNARKIFDQLLQLSARPSLAGIKITHVIWPESSVPFLIDESPEGKAELRRTLNGEKILMAGAVRRSSVAPVNGVDPSYYTSVLVFDGWANVLTHYDKSHLVPGGEYLPLAWALEPLGFRKVVNLPEGFTPGAGPQSIAIPGAGLASLQICYESIFPNKTIDVANRPDWIVNVTNDGWFGNSAGPYQHLAQMRLRAIEQGLPVARAANTGISAIIDPVGRYVEMTELGKIDARDSRLPEKLQPTVYFYVQDGVLFLGLFSLFLFGLFQRRRP
jgi:apolipoprotein N-acyltransferase